MYIKFKLKEFREKKRMVAKKAIQSERRIPGANQRIRKGNYQAYT